MSRLVFILSPVKRPTRWVFQIIYKRHAMLMTISDAPQLNCHHSGSFTILNVLRRIAVVQDLEMIAATRLQNGLADRRVPLDCH
jgi:hypothetical protein